MRTILLLLFVGFFTTSFTQEKDKVDQITITIKPYKHTTNGAFHTFLALTCSDRGVEFIDEFDFEWGFSYELKVKRTRLAQPMEDAGDTDYQLIKVISKKATPDSTIFKVHLTGWVQLAPNIKDDNGAFIFNNDGTCTYLSEMTFNYPRELEEKLKTLNKSEGYIRGTFMFLEGAIHLVSL
tara:strand:- start:23543 stop:24085 length:543 start_codon:yes stop_codon:yes gene_type:complete